MLTLRDLARWFPGPPRRPLFEHVNLELAPGEFVAIVGESGVGKSTLLHCIAGLERPDAGEVVVDGTALSGLDDRAVTELRRAKLGFVFQAFHILPWLDVAANVALPLGLLGHSAAASRERAIAMLASVGLGDRAASQPRELSGGELQRVALSRALVHRTASGARRRTDRQPRPRERRARPRTAAFSGHRTPVRLHPRDALAPRRRRRRSRAATHVERTRTGARLVGRLNARTARLWHWFALVRGPLRQHPARFALSVLAISIGVSLGLAVQIINASAVDEFAAASRALSGEADITIRGPRDGFDENLYPVLARTPGVSIASPVVEVEARLADRDDAIRVLGIDVFRAIPLQPGLIAEGVDRLDLLRPDTVFLSPIAAAALHANIGDTLRFRSASGPAACASPARWQASTRAAAGP